MQLYFLFQSISQSFTGGFKIMPGLEVHPELCFHSEKASHSQGSCCLAERVKFRESLQRLAVQAFLPLQVECSVAACVNGDR